MLQLSWLNYLRFLGLLSIIIFKCVMLWDSQQLFFCFCPMWLFSTGTNPTPSASLQRTHSADFRVQTFPISHSLRAIILLTAWDRMRKCKSAQTETQTMIANLANCFKYLKKYISMKISQKEEEEKKKKIYIC